MDKCPICKTIVSEESQDYCLNCAWEFEYYFDELGEEEKNRYKERFQIYKKQYLKSLETPEFKWKYFYSFIDINSSKGSLAYQFLADNRKKSFSYPVRRRKFELIGGSRFDSLNFLARLDKKDKALLILFPEEGKAFFGVTNQVIRVIALQEGLVYLDKKEGFSKKIKIGGFKDEEV